MIQAIIIIILSIALFVVNFVWAAFCKKINDEWTELCMKMITDWKGLCSDIIKENEVQED